MAKNKTYSIGAFVGEGRTITEARAACEARIAAYCEEMASGPGVVVQPDRVAVLLPAFNGGIATRRYDAMGIDRCSSFSHRDSLAEAITGEAAHAARCQWTGDDMPHPEHAWRFDSRAMADWHSWVKWQRRFQDAKKAGLSHNDAHSYAGQNPGRPELWQGIDHSEQFAVCPGGGQIVACD